MDKRKKDPVAETNKQSEQAVIKEELTELDASKLSLSDLKAIPESAASGSHPFQGYPQPKIDLPNLGKISATSIVVLHPNHYVFQDHSGKGQTIQEVNKAGRKTGNSKIVNLKTFHSRLARNLEEGGKSEDFVFDREITLEGGQKALFAIVPSHSCRAQICFKIVKEKIKVDNRYLLLDGEQTSRLRECFRRVHYQQMQAERMARDFDDGKGDFASQDGG